MDIWSEISEGTSLIASGAATPLGPPSGKRKGVGVGMPSLVAAGAAGAVLEGLSGAARGVASSPLHPLPAQIHWYH